VTGGKKSFDLEQVIPIFPLHNVVLFPRVRLPLHIFEPRYRQMVEDSVATHGLIGMALLRGNWQKDYYGNPDIYPVGCVGEVGDVAPFPDGRSNIVLLGLREYELKEHILNVTPYRQARVLMREEPKEMEKKSFSLLKDEIQALIRRIINDDGSPFLNILRDPSLDQESWVNLCSFVIDVSIMEKQSLLEAKSLEERASHLLNLLKFKLLEMGTPSEGLDDAGGRKPPH
jgi:Lon protease-like protein